MPAWRARVRRPFGGNLRLCRPLCGTGGARRGASAAAIGLCRPLRLRRRAAALLAQVARGDEPCQKREQVRRGPIGALAGTWLIRHGVTLLRSLSRECPDRYLGPAPTHGRPGVRAPGLPGNEPRRL